MNFWSILIVSVFMLTVTVIMAYLSLFVVDKLFPGDLSCDEKKDFFGCYCQITPDIFGFFAVFTACYFAVMYDFFPTIATIILYLLGIGEVFRAIIAPIIFGASVKEILSYDDSDASCKHACIVSVSFLIATDIIVYGTMVYTLVNYLF